MIEIRNLTKSYRVQNGRHCVFKDISLSLPDGANIGIIGPNGAGKSTFLRLLGGIDHPDSGEIRSSKSFSWPLGLKGGFINHMTGRQNCRVICNLYGLPPRAIKGKLGEIKELSGIGDYFEEPVKYYSSGMGGRLGFALSMAFDFDYFLIDEITSVGDAHFKRIAKEALESKARQSRVIMVSHSVSDLRKFCDMAILMRDGELTVFDSLDQAVDEYLGTVVSEMPSASEVSLDDSIQELGLETITLPTSVSTPLAQITEGLETLRHRLTDTVNPPEIDESEFHHALGQAYATLGDTKSARRHFSLSSQVDPHFLKPLLKLAKIAASDGDAKSLEQALTAAETLHPENADVLTLRIERLLATGQAADALEYCQRGLTQHPKRHAFWHFRARACQALNQPGEALAATIEALRLAPNNQKYLRTLGMLYAEAGEFASAQMAYEKIRLLKHQNPPKPPPEPSLEGVAKTINKLLSETSRSNA
ncbi:MAG: ATP-binding cassette domain-containing protein [Opitutales bacterium]|nr:ATP-binding cassette domain-containing protein [Opitutales bacterium]